MKSTTKKSVYKIITERVIEGLESQGLQWFKPWTNEKSGVTSYAINYETKRYYEGINSFMLTGAIAQYNYKSFEFVTKKQAENAGGSINPDAVDHLVTYWMFSYFYKNVWYKNAKALKDATGLNPNSKGVTSTASPRYYKVYNLCETTGLESLTSVEIEEAKKDTVFENKDAEKVFADMPQKPTLRHFGNKAYYSPTNHHIQMPNKTQFIAKTKCLGDYYKTLFHEMIHATGHEDLLNRSTLVNSAGFRSETYSREELVAEMGSMFLVGITGIETTDGDKNSQAYINGWISNLKKEENEKDILFASAQAKKAVRFILNK